MAQGCWVGIKKCGCYVAVVRDDNNPDHAKHTEEAKHKFLSEGLSVVFATDAEWEQKYFPKFLEDCTHAAAVSQ